MKNLRPFSSTIIALLLMAHLALPTSAHQPYFEEGDLSFESPMQVANPQISTAFYATLESTTDVDYFTFEGRAGESVLFGMSIPQIDGQDEFAPTIAVLHPDFPSAEQINFAPDVSTPNAILMRDDSVEAPVFFEPFSRTRYWRRQRETISLPADGSYMVAVWSEQGQVGRYTFVIGEQEVRGGDPAFSSKIVDFWTPVPVPVEVQPTPTAQPHESCPHGGWTNG